MNGTFVAISLCLIQPSLTDFNASASMHQSEMKLSDSERDKIFRQIQFAIQKMNTCMNKADSEASKITDLDIRSTTKAAIQGCICGLGGRSPYAVVVGGCLGALSHIGGEAYDHFCRCRDYIKDAEYYAYEADRLQEKLWRDE